MQPEIKPSEMTYKNYNFRIAEEGKLLYILNTLTGEQSAIDVYERAKADDDRETAELELPKDKRTPVDSVFVFENTGIKIYICSYHYREDDYATVDFNAYIKR